MVHRAGKKSWPTRRDALIGGLASGAFMIGGPAFAQAANGLVAATGDLPAPPHDDTVQILHGVSIPDPYRPLEDIARADTKAWIEAQDARARGMIDALPIRKQLHDFLNAALDYPRTTIPGQ
jgi:prolyl oligopeptidase